MNQEEIEKIEIDFFIEALYRRYGYDFRHYAKASVRRRVRHLLAQTGADTISALTACALHDEAFALAAIQEFSITVTEMFRDPDFYRAVREKIVPYLKTYPFIKVWVAGCATGEEVYSLAILLHEEGLYERATLFATDFNESALQRAREGIYPLKNIQQYTANYQQAGGRRSFADYYHAEYNSALLGPALRANITFANHNLVTDGVFGEAQLIFCRNVMIYFDQTLQNRVLTVLTESLAHGGFLCLGARETLNFASVVGSYRVVDEEQRLYQKRAS